MRAKVLKVIRRTLVHLYLILASGLGLFPFVYSLSLSFKTEAELYSGLPFTFIPRNPTLVNYQYVLKAVSGGQGSSFMLVLYRNTLFVSVTSVILTVLIASLAGYAFARVTFLGRNAIFAFFIVLMFLPSGGTLMAQFVLMRRLHLVDNLLGLALLYTGGGGVALFLMRQVFLNVPMDIEDAARVDGASDPRIAFQIMFPLATSGMVLIAIMGFISTWGEYLVARTMIRTAGNMTLSIGINLISELARGNVAALVDQRALYATVLGFVTLPVIVIFVVLQKWFIRGAVEGLKL